jgi:hypothetical protein
MLGCVYFEAQTKQMKCPSKYKDNMEAAERISLPLLRE